MNLNFYWHRKNVHNSWTVKATIQCQTYFDAKDTLEKVSDDGDDIFEKVSDDSKDILEKVSDDGDDIKGESKKNADLFLWISRLARGLETEFHSIF